MIITSPILLPALLTATVMLVGVRGSRLSAARVAPIRAARQDRIRQLGARRTALSRMLVTVERLHREVVEVTLPRSVSALQKLENVELDALCADGMPRIGALPQRQIRRAGLSPKSRSWVLGGPVPARLLGVCLSRDLRAALSGKTVQLSEEDGIVMRRLQSAIDRQIATLAAARDALQQQHRAHSRQLAQVRVALQAGRDYRRMSRYPLPGQSRSTWQLVQDHIRSTQQLIAMASATAG